MVQLFRAGITAICWQVIAVLALTLAVLFTASSSFSSANPSPLTWGYPLVAVGLALTGGQSINVTAIQMRRASYIMRRAAPKPILVMVVAQFVFGTVLLAILTVYPPHAVIVVIGFFGDDSVATIIWSAVMSAGVAGFGATAHAGLKAIELSNGQH
jgi:RsiW-degrading membrane proteinase PrsW (M82 family)